MILLEFYETGKKVNFPESLAECNQREYVSMCRFIYLYQSGEITIEQFQRLSVYSLLNVQVSKKPLSQETEKAISENVAFLSDYVMNFFEIIEEEETKKITIKQNYIHNHIPSFKFNGLTYVGPKNNLEDVNFGDYMDGLGAFMDYEAFNEKSSLIKLFKIFYRPKLKFISKVNQPDFSKLDLGILYGFYMFFASFQKWISSSASVHYNGVEINLSIIFSGKESKAGGSKIPGLGMKSLFHSIAESGVFGSAKELREAPLWDVLFFMYEMRKKRLDEEAELERIKKNPKNKSK